MHVYEKELSPINLVHILSVRAVENLIPLPVYKEVYRDARDIQAKLHVIDRIDNVNDCRPGEEYFRFINLKEGCCVSAIKKLDENRKEYLIKMWKNARPDHIERDINDFDDPDEILVPGISRNIMERVVEFLQHPAHCTYMRASCIKSWLRAEYEELVLLILSFSACLQRLRV